MPNFNITPNHTFATPSTGTTHRYECSSDQFEQILEDLDTLGYWDKEGEHHNGYRLGMLDTFSWLAFTRMVDCKRKVQVSTSEKFIAIQEDLFEKWTLVIPAIETCIKNRGLIIDQITGEEKPETLNVDIIRLAENESTVKTRDEWLATMQVSHETFYAKFGINKTHSLKEAFNNNKLPKEIYQRTADKIKELIQENTTTTASALVDTMIAMDVPFQSVWDVMTEIGFTKDNIPMDKDAIGTDIANRMQGAHTPLTSHIDDLDTNVIYHLLSMVVSKMGTNANKASNDAFNATGNDWLVNTLHENEGKFLTVKLMAKKFVDEAKQVDNTNTQEEIIEKFDTEQINRNLELPANHEYNVANNIPH